MHGTAPAFDSATGTPQPLTIANARALQRLAGNRAVAALLSETAVQRSTKGASMPGLGVGGSGIAKGSRKRGRGGSGGKELPPPRRATRSSTKPVADMTRPTLTVTSQYEGVANQRRDVEQAIGIDQHAVLTRPAGAVRSAASYYSFRQQVRDGWASYPPAATDQAVGANFVQDGPFRPNYENENITVTNDAIDFHDHPGFSTTTKIAAGSWLQWYEVRFRWVVTERDAPGRTWTSPEIVHRIDAPFAAGNPVAVQAAVAPNVQWTAHLA